MLYLTKTIIIITESFKLPLIINESNRNQKEKKRGGKEEGMRVKMPFSFFDFKIQEKEKIFLRLFVWQVLEAVGQVLGGNGGRCWGQWGEVLGAMGEVLGQWEQMLGAVRAVGGGAGGSGGRCWGQVGGGAGGAMLGEVGSRYWGQWEQWGEVLGQWGQVLGSCGRRCWG